MGCGLVTSNGSLVCWFGRKNCLVNWCSPWLTSLICPRRTFLFKMLMRRVHNNIILKFCSFVNHKVNKIMSLFESRFNFILRTSCDRNSKFVNYIKCAQRSCVEYANATCTSCYKSSSFSFSCHYKTSVNVFDSSV